MPLSRGFRLANELSYSKEAWQAFTYQCAHSLIPELGGMLNILTVHSILHPILFFYFFVSVVLSQELTLLPWLAHSSCWSFASSSQVLELQVTQATNQTIVCFVLLLLFSFPILEVRAQISCSLPSVNCRPQDNGITWDTKLQPVIPFASLQKVFGTCGLIFQQCEDSVSPALLFHHSSDWTWICCKRPTTDLPPAPPPFHPF